MSKTDKVFSRRSFNIGLPTKLGLLLIALSGVSFIRIRQSSTVLDRDRQTELLAANASFPELNIRSYAASGGPKAKLPTESPHSVKGKQLNIKRQTKPSFSFCLLLKDDNDILNEWIAYHYHTMNLRHLIVAHDPSNQTSPSAIFQTWRNYFGLQIDEWTDKDYMPNFFLNGSYHLVPSFLPDAIKDNISASFWHSETTDLNTIQEDLYRINNHRFRQVTFVTNCIKALRKTNRTWMAHIDTDEYIVVNPVLRERPHRVDNIAPLIPYESSIVNFLETMYTRFPKRLHRACLMMPKIMYGSAEDGNGTQTIPDCNMSRFETLRWKYHASLKDAANGLQKAIMDVTAIPEDDMVLQQYAHSVHQPSKSLCRQMTLYPKIDEVRLFPLTLNHYVGSYERYRSRIDVRRNEKIYQEKAGVRGGRDDGWILGWLESFIHKHGKEKATLVLGDYLASGYS